MGDCAEKVSGVVFRLGRRVGAEGLGVAAVGPGNRFMGRCVDPIMAWDAAARGVTIVR